MAKKKKKKMPYGGKLLTIENEKELVEWAEKQASKISPHIREMYYDKTEPKNVVELAKEMGVYDYQTYGKTVGNILRAARNNFFIVFEDISEADYINHMEDFYIPRMREIHARTATWIELEMQKYAGDEYSKIVELTQGSFEIVYMGPAGLNKSSYSVLNGWGQKVCSFLYNGSDKTFEMFWE